MFSFKNNHMLLFEFNMKNNNNKSHKFNFLIIYDHLNSYLKVQFNKRFQVSWLFVFLLTVIMQYLFYISFVINYTRLLKYFDLNVTTQLKLHEMKNNNNISLSYFLKKNNLLDFSILFENLKLLNLKKNNKINIKINFF